MGLFDFLKPVQPVRMRRPECDIYNFSEEMLQAEHLLIAGTTGCGKSTLLNTILTDGLYLGCMYYLIDLKKTELWQYKGLPNTFGYCNEFKDVERLLDDMLYQMDMRFKQLARNGMKKSAAQPLYFVIDEYADVINLCPTMAIRRRIESKLMRLASQGRASNCHLILCTQRCTSDILSSKIKSCITTKIGMHTVSSQESRNIIGVSGCEFLPRYGRFKLVSPNHYGVVEGETPAYSEQEVSDRIKTYRDFNRR